VLYKINKAHMVCKYQNNLYGFKQFM